MDFNNWKKGVKAHAAFEQEEKTEYKGRVRQAKIFVDAEEVYVKPDPRINVFYMDEKAKAKEHDATEWLDAEAVEGLITHSAKMGGGKAGVKKGKKKGSTMGGGDVTVVFDPFRPQDNLQVNGGPIPFSRNHKLKKKKVKEVQTVGIEESMGSYGVETTDSPDYGDGSYGDGIDRPKAVKQMSDKRKRAMLIKGVTNPADSMRRDLAHKAQMDVYKKNKGIVTETNVDHREIAAYGAVDIRRKTDGDDEVKMMTEDEVEALQAALDEEKAAKMRVVAEKELFQKEEQLVIRRLGDALVERRVGAVGRVFGSKGVIRQAIRSMNMQYEEPTKFMPWCWVGDSTTAHDKKRLVDLGITHILNCAVESDNGFPDMFIYCKIALYDSSDQAMDGVFEHAFKFMDRARESGGRILVHCSTGVSRAAMLLMAYLVKVEEQLLIDVYLFCKHLRPIIDINDNFLYHLALLEMNTHSVTSVAFHKIWKFYKYTQLKSGADENWDAGPVDRKQGVGLFVMAVFRKLGVPRRKGCLTKLMEDIYGAFYSAKQKNALAQQKISQRQASKRATEKGK